LKNGYALMYAEHEENSYETTYKTQASKNNSLNYKHINL